MGRCGGDAGSSIVELQDYLVILRKRWVSIFVLTVLAVGAAVGASLLMTPTYVATTQVYVSVQGGTTTADMLQGSNFTQQQVTSYAELVTSPLVLNPVIATTGLDMRAETLATHVTASSPLNTSLIDISVSDTNPAIAAALAQAISVKFTQVIAALETPASGGPSTVKVSIVSDAVAPEKPASPNPKLNVALGLLVGLALGVGFAVLRAVLDTRVRNESDVAKVTDTSVIGSIGYDQDASEHPLIVQTGPHSHRSESFRRLRTNLQFLDIADRPQSIVVTSSLPGEGKSTTTINLAITLADAGSRVALIDADLRRPSVAKYMGIEGGVGLTTVLIGRAAVEDVIQPWGNGYLHVLPSGQIPPNPSELLGSRAMAALLDKLTHTYDIVLLDTAPLLPVTDAAILSKLTGGAVLVVSADQLHRNQLAESIGALETVDARILGIVVNRLARKQGDQYAYYDYASHSEVSGSSGARGTKQRRGSKKLAKQARPTRPTSAPDAAPREPSAGVPSEGLAGLWPPLSGDDQPERVRRS